MKRLLSIIIILGLLVRLLFLGLHEFWFDEAFSYFLAKLPFSSLLIATAADNNPPFYYLLLRFWLLFGENHLYLRFLSLIFGVLSIPLTYLIVKQLGEKDEISLLATLIFSFSPMMIYFSTETRMYQLLVLESLLIIFLFNRLSRKRKILDVTLFIITGILGIYTHYYFGLLLLLLFIFSLTQRTQRSQLLFWLALYGSIALAFLPWLPEYFKFQHPGCWCFSPIIGIPATLASFSINGVGVISFRDMSLLSSSQVALLSLVAGLFITFFLIGSRQELLAKKLTLAVFLLGTSFFLVTLISFFQPFFSPRAFILFAPLFYLLSAKGLHSLTKGSFLYSTLITVSLLGSVILLFATQDQFKGQPLGESASFISRNYQKGDVVAHTSVYTFYTYRYLLGEKTPQFITLQSDLSPHTIFQIGGYAKEIDEVVKKGDRLWLVHIPIWTSIDKANTTNQLLARRYHLLKMEEFDQIEVLLFEVSP